MIVGQLEGGPDVDVGFDWAEGVDVGVFVCVIVGVGATTLNAAYNLNEPVVS